MTTSFEPGPAVTAPVTALDPTCDILILGIGNLLWADEGFGIRALETLHQAWRFGPGVRLMDGGTQGLYLLPYVEACRRLLVFDAVDYGLAPGTLKIVRDDAVPAFMGAKKMSLHQTGFQEVLAVAGLRGWQPEAICLIGLQPEMLEDYGGSLTATVKAALPGAVAAGLDVLTEWGAMPERRLVPPGPDEHLTLDSLAMAPYEDERPSAEAAWRMGDARFMQDPGGLSPSTLTRAAAHPSTLEGEGLGERGGLRTAEGIHGGNL